MKKNLWLVFGVMISSSLVAQPVTGPDGGPPVVRSQQPLLMDTPSNPPAQIETPGSADAITSAPAATLDSQSAPTNSASAPNSSAKAAPKKPARKHASPKKNAGSELKTVPLVPGPATVQVSPDSRVNVRGRPGLIGEVVTQVTNGQPVTVLEEIDLKHSGPDEPSAWAKILLPNNDHVWVSGAFIDANNTVTATRLNLRGGPGENYSVLGRLDRGDTVQKIGEKGNWIEIQPPTNAYAFVAAQYLTQEAPAIASATPESTNSEMAATEPPATTSEVTNEPTIAAAEAPSLPEDMTSTNVTGSSSNELAMANTNGIAAGETSESAMEDTQEQEPPPPRIVAREGIVRGTVSIQAPTAFELISPDTRQTIDYLYTTSPNLDLSRYKGLHIIVTGEEGLDERWKSTPVITIQKIQVLD